MKPAEAMDRELVLEADDFRERARTGLLNFTLYTKPEFEVNWHHRLLCRYLNAFIRGRIPRLLIQAPPRHGKSELVSRRLPALLLGQNPDCEVICATYNQKFASSLNRDVQRVMTTREYRELFPDTRLNERNIRTVADGTWLRNAEMFEVVGRKGKYVSAGTSGTLTGKGGDFAIIDDPIRGWEDAISETKREAIWEWYSAVLLTRLSKVNRICLTMTRWHESDLAGRLMEKMKADPDADQWVVVNLPALKEGTDRECADDPREVGDALWPDRYPEERLLKVKKNNEQVFTSLFQQRPAPLEGNIIKSAWWKRFKTWPDRTTMDEIVLTIDLPYKRRGPKSGSRRPGAKLSGGKSTDYASFQVWGKRGTDAFLLHCLRERMTFTEQLKAAVDILKAWPDVTAKLVEAKANGEALIDQLRAKVPGLIGVNPLTDKVNRAWAVSPFVRAGNVWIPDSSLAPWVDDFVLEWAVFPAGANDDSVDASCQVLLYWYGRTQLHGAPPLSFTKESAWLGVEQEEEAPWMSPSEPDQGDDIVRSIALR